MAFNYRREASILLEEVRSEQISWEQFSFITLKTIRHWLQYNVFVKLKTPEGNKLIRKLQKS